MSQKKEPTLAEQAAKYREECNLTEEFFCKYDPMQDYELGFVEDGKNHVKPCCKPVASIDYAHAQRLETVNQLNQIVSRIKQFQELTHNLASLGLPSEMDTNVETLTKISSEIEQQIHKCVKPIYSENLNTLTHLNSSICEPLDKVVTTIQTIFYPKMYIIEKAIAESKSQAANNSWFSWIMSAFKKGVEKLKNSLVTASFYLLSQNQTALEEFNSAAPQRFKIVKETLCVLTKHKEKKEDEALQEIFKDSFSIIQALLVPQKAVLIRNSVRKLCNRKDHKVLEFVENTVDNWLSSVKDDDEFKKEISTLREKLDTSACLFVALRQADQFDDNVLALILWMICMTSLQMFVVLAKQQFGTIQQFCVATLNLKGLSNTLVSNDKFDLNNVPDISTTMNFSNQAVNAGIFKTTDAKNTATFHTVPKFIDALFAFFWFLVEHDFLPKNDVEQSLERYFDENAFNKNTDVPSVLTDVPDYVRFAYCLAQNNSEEDCTQLVKNKTPMEALANGEDRYFTYLTLARLEAEEAQRAAEAVPTERELKKELQKTINEYTKTSK